MIPGFGKQSISTGSSPSSDIRLGGPGVQPVHARIERKPNGSLVLINAGGSTRAGGEALAANEERPFDFITSFVLGEGAALPLTHPAITLMLLSRGQAPASPGEIRIGRDPARNDIVVQHPVVSGQHATLARSPLAITDPAAVRSSITTGCRAASRSRCPPARSYGSAPCRSRPRYWTS